MRTHSARFRAAIATVTSLLLLVGWSGPAPAATRSSVLYVDDDGHAGAARGCRGRRDVPTQIQKAVDAAGPGNTIFICPGRYRGYVRVSGSDKDGLIIRAVRPWTAILEPPAPPTKPYCSQFGHCPKLFAISGTDDVQVRSLTFVAPTTGDCQKVLAMIYVTDHSLGTVLSDSHVAAEGPRTLLRRCGFFNGVQIEHGSGAWLDGNVIQDFSATGIIAKGAGTEVAISHNRVLFYHENETAPDGGCWGVGIFVGDVATGMVRANYVASLPLKVSRPFLCTGIELRRGFASKVVGNTVRYSNWGVETDLSEDPLVEENSIHSWIGLHLFEQAGGTVRNNVTTDFPGGFGIWVAYNTRYVRISDNDFRGHDTNRYYDCRDHSSGSGTAGTANIWTNNLGDPAKSDPSGICSLPVSNADGVSARGAPSRQAIEEVP